MRLESINTEQEYDQALKRLDEIFDANKGTEEGEELELLGYLIEKYEDEHFPILFPESHNNYDAETMNMLYERRENHRRGESVSLRVEESLALITKK